MARRNWKDHPCVGLTIGYSFNGESVDCKIVDVKSGPMFADLSSKVGDVRVSGSLKLRLKPPGGVEFWTGPINGEQLCAWADKKRAIKEDA